MTRATWKLLISRSRPLPPNLPQVLQESACLGAPTRCHALRARGPQTQARQGSRSPCVESAAGPMSSSAPEL